MKAEKGLGPVKRFGVRYGRTVKWKLAKIEKEQKQPQICPYCDRPKAKRLFSGVYQCSKCNSKFTGRAYAIEKKAPSVIEGEEEKHAPTEEEEEQTDEEKEEAKE